MGKKGTFSFSIETARELLDTVLKQDAAELDKSPRSSRHAIHCAFVAWHLHEWLWATRFKGDYVEQKRVFGVTFRDGKNQAGESLKAMHHFAARCRKDCPELEAMQGVAEGSKHLGTKAVEGTVDDLHSSQFGRAMLGSTLFGSAGVLAVINKDKTTVEFIPALRQVIAFWEKILNT